MYTKESLNIVREKEKITFPILRDLIKLLDNSEMKPFSICDSNAVRAYSKFKRSSHDFDIIFPNSINREQLVKQFPAIKYHKKVNNADFYRMETIIPTLNQPNPFYIDFHISGYILDNPLKIFLVDSIFFDKIQYRNITSINDFVKTIVPVPALEELLLLKDTKIFSIRSLRYSLYANR